MAETPSIKDTAAALASIKGGSTTDITIKLYRAFMKVPDSIPDSDPDLRRIIRFNMEAAQMRKQISLDFTSRLTETVSNIDASIAQLKSNKTTIQYADGYTQRFGALKAETTERITQREELIRDITEYVNKQHGEVPEVLREILEGKKQKAQAFSMLDGVFKNRPDLLSRAIKLEANEKLLQQRLDDLHRDAYQTVAPQDRINISPPIGLTLDQVAEKRLGG